MEIALLEKVYPIAARSTTMFNDVYGYDSDGDGFIDTPAPGQSHLISLRGGMGR